MKQKQEMHTKTMWRILGFAFLLRALIGILVFPITLRNHTLTYLEPIASWARTGAYTMAGQPDLTRPPGYALLMWPGVALGRFEEVTIALQVLLSTLSVYLVYRITLLLTGKTQTSEIAAFLYAVEPLAIIFTGTLLSETLYVTVLCGFFYYFIRYLQEFHIRHLLAAALMLAGTVYVRPIGYYLPGLIALVMGVLSLTLWGRNWKRLAHAGVFFAVCMGLIGLWQLRNYKETGYAGFSVIAEINMYYYQGLSVLSEQTGIPFYTLQETEGYSDDLSHFANVPWLANPSLAERYRTLNRRGVELVMSAPWTYFKIHMAGLVRTLLDPGAVRLMRILHRYPQKGGLLGDSVDKGLRAAVEKMMADWPHVFWASIVLGLILAIEVALCAISFLDRAVWRNAGVMAVALTGSYLFFLSGGPNAEGRFRHPVMVSVCILGGIGASLAVCFWEEKRKRTKVVPVSSVNQDLPVDVKVSKCV